MTPTTYQISLYPSYDHLVQTTSKVDSSINIVLGNLLQQHFATCVSNYSQKLLKKMMTNSKFSIISCIWILYQWFPLTPVLVPFGPILFCYQLSRVIWRGCTLNEVTACFFTQFCFLDAIPEISPCSYRMHACKLVILVWWHSTDRQALPASTYMPSCKTYLHLWLFFNT